MRQQILDAIKAKIDGEDITQAEPEEPKGQIIDLMSALKASLAGSSGDADETSERKPATRVEPESAEPMRKAAGDAEA